ncbi:PREDICTED: ribonuclease T2 isoform X1 [Hipposideros armiger]|uniref:Ribonuclease T2 isoform X1 n=1 Tax=Hipposideros armiger TaxID=186990 RepID=A0A8B7SSK4_HIPAR|nr:PREDICTED: ribonuclease T2 isoform X1 [Hipposideros armiger]
MTPAAPGRVLLCCLGLAFGYLCCAHGLWSSDNHEWEKLIMVHHWPATVCKPPHIRCFSHLTTPSLMSRPTWKDAASPQAAIAEEGARLAASPGPHQTLTSAFRLRIHHGDFKEVENDCRNPPDYWTIHGLWPDKAEECNRSWHFNLDEIKDLLQDMRIYWPDVIHSSPNGSFFWKHEWQKHGTCAAQLDALNSQKKYFAKGLDLYRGLALNSMLQKLGIIPSGNYYQIADIKDALAGLYGVIPKIQCLLPKQGEEVQTIGQIELCFTKDLQLRNCTEPGELAAAGQGTWSAGAAMGLQVCKDGPVFYPPPQETNH